MNGNSFAIGARRRRVLLQHIIPNTIPLIIVLTFADIGGLMVTESVLSFLGLGVQPPDPSWGNMLNAARSTVVLEKYVWQWMFPGLALVLTVLSINFIGDGLRDAFDPRSDLN